MDAAPHRLEETPLRPRVLLLLPTSTYRTQDFLKAAERLGVDVTVASEEPSTMEGLAPEALMTLDFLKPRDAAERIRAFHERYPLRAIIPVDEETAVVAASASEGLDLPHNPPVAAERARLKHRMRQALDAVGVRVPAFRVLEPHDDPEVLTTLLGFPMVVKPVFLSGSRGVVRVDDLSELKARVSWLRSFLARPEIARHGGASAGLVLAEAFVSGREFAVEALLTDSELAPLALFDKPDPLEGPLFEETLYVTPSRLDAATQRAILDTTAQAAKALGLRHGPVHAELRVAEGGAPTVIEVAGRSIGGLCSRMLRFGLGRSLEEILLEHALGGAPSEREAGAAGVLMIPIPRAGRLEAVRGVERARLVDGIEEVTISIPLGSRIVPLPEGASYLGFVFARGDSPDGVETALREAQQALDFEIV